ncbi:type II toxin-antitoxin system HicB family antitoxin [bacterium]|nr:type II toxin-antitoxin system HicB family antitoxin [bacterium]
MVIMFETYHDGEFWCARGINHDIFTNAKTYEKLLKNIKEAVALHFEEEIENKGTLDILIMSEMEVNFASSSGSKR